jgi:hypothetical protein
LNHDFFKKDTLKKWGGQVGFLVFIFYEYKENVSLKEVDGWVIKGWEIHKTRYWFYSSFKNRWNKLILDQKIKIVGISLASVLGLLKSLF